MKETAARVGWMLIVPLLLVNSAATWGQAGWAHDHVTTPDWRDMARWVVAVLFAVAIESVGVFLAGMAHAARMADQSAATLQLGSYLVGLLVGFLNYWHFAGPDLQPTPQAVAFGALSSISPWLWAIYSRYRNRDRLAELGQVDKRGVKLSTSRKFWHPIKSIWVIRFASWEGIVEPDEAVRAWTEARGLVDAKRRFLAAQPGLPTVLPFDEPEEPAEEPGAWRIPLRGTEEEPVDPWTFSRDLRLVPKPLDDFVAGALRAPNTKTSVFDPKVHRPAPGEPLDDFPHLREPEPAAEPSEPEPAGPATDEELFARFGDALRLAYRAEKLNRYQVEKITGAARRQAERLLDLVTREADQSDQKGDQVVRPINGTKEQA